MDYLEPITTKLDEISTHQVLFYIFIAFTLMVLFFLLSLKDLQKLETQEQYDQQHSIYNSNEYNNLVNKWTKQAVDNLQKDLRYQEWLKQKQDNLSQSSFKQSSIK